MAPMMIVAIAIAALGLAVLFIAVAMVVGLMTMGRRVDKLENDAIAAEPWHGVDPFPTQPPAGYRPMAAHQSIGGFGIAPESVPATRHLSAAHVPSPIRTS